ncbi:MBL fold metallo-hydrolase [Orenia metallireducens]|uniref:MBL fold metallo-hydrolase n=1 Tax=Orenia metallireducens TaxID=1413210 RepID=A0A1C0A4U7_9FIRM|nr:MBL fold metallo-hydrolase [Orenia metallireducens]OCL25143.1 MBL fold metallo-hydrolase [Orenia metallireducens]
MFIKRLAVGALSVNCYIVADEESKEAVVIDPGAQAKAILKVINDNNLKVKYVINTHGHNDHIAANSQLLEETDAQLLIHKDDAEFLQNSELNLSFFIGEMGQQLECPKADRLLEDGEEIECGSLVFSVIHTPGHTPGSICLKLENILFTGDTIFARGVGRTDFPMGSYSALRKSIERILEFKEDLKICPGHGPESTLNRARSENSYI